MEAKDKLPLDEQTSGPSATDRRRFLTGLVTTAATLAATPFLLNATTKQHHKHHGPFVPRVPVVRNLLVGTGTPDGILRFGWNAETGELTEAGIAATLAKPGWITLSPERHFLYAACEVAGFDGKPTGGIASFRIVPAANNSVKLEPISRANSAGPGTCHVAVDETGRVLVSADYDGGSAASFLSEQGKFGQHVWSEKYSGSGPVASRQEQAHAHFASFSPDSQFGYINDLGSDCIHIYTVDAATAKLKPAGSFRSHAGAGPRTLHFHANGHTGYVVNELDSTVDVVEWNRVNGSLTQTAEIKLLPEGYSGITRACDTVLTSDGQFAYFANRGDDFLYAFHTDPSDGHLTPIARTPSGGHTPRHFTLDPTERWMLVANQDSNLIAVFARDKKTGELASEGKSYPAKVPMSLVLV
jgi:6-phosphogluconolactonase